MIAKEKKRELSLDEILYLTSNGMDIYEKELRLKKDGEKYIGLCPLHSEKTPSFTVFKDGNYCCFGCGNKGSNAINLVMELFHLSFKEAIQKVKWDFNLTDKKVDNFFIKHLQEGKKEDRRIAIDIKFEPFLNWEDRHKQFWEVAQIPWEFASDKIYAVNNAWIANSKVRIGKNEVVWAYLADENKVKLYFPERKKQERFRNNVPGNYLWGFNSAKECEKLIVSKSVKDMIVLSYIFPCVVATQNENAAIVDEVMKDKIESLSKDIYLSWGSDIQGTEQSILVTNKYNWNWCNPDKKFLPSNDPYSLAKAYGIEEVKNMLKHKKLL